ncbi:MAG: hypothetical protein OEL58_07670 [Desulfobacteraceae bacterium]|jgi:hypothetical protein|nr:hypothetical protein [Desulfobacteraceae bacterium]
MSIQPTGEDLRKAVKWVSDERKYNPGKELKAVLQEACVKFDLSPLDENFLCRTLLEKTENSKE